MEFWKIIPIFAQVVIKLFDFVSFPGSSSLGKNEKIFFFKKRDVQERKLGWATAHFPVLVATQ